VKTTIEISEVLLRQLRQLAVREAVTLRAMVERELHRVVAEKQRGATFKLRRASFKGKGRRAELRGAPWETLRDLTYKDRGG
jgi:hypothetical protein